MNVTGYTLKEALKMRSLELSTINTQWDESLYAFDDENKESPIELADTIASFEDKLALLQTAQDYYNLYIKVKVGSEEMSLSQAIKLVGGAGRLSKRWRSAAQGEQVDRWSRRDALSRKTDEEHAKATVTKSSALTYAKKAEKYAAQLRTAIATGNTVVLDINWVTEDLLS